MAIEESFSLFVSPDKSSGSPLRDIIAYTVYQAKKRAFPLGRKQSITQRVSREKMLGTLLSVCPGPLLASHILALASSCGLRRRTCEKRRCTQVSHRPSSPNLQVAEQFILSFLKKARLNQDGSSIMHNSLCLRMVCQSQGAFPQSLATRDKWIRCESYTMPSNKCTVQRNSLFKFKLVNWS